MYILICVVCNKGKMVPNSKEKRPRIARTDDWPVVKQRSLWPEQVTYEMIRPVVLFSEPAAERSKEIGEPRTSLYRSVERFEQQGMSGLFLPTPKQREDTHRNLPTALRETIIELKAEFSFLHLREIATVCYVRFGRKPSHHTIQRVLAETSPSPNTHRRYPLWAEMTDPAERRLAAIRLHADGLHVTSIAAYLGTSRQTIHTTLKGIKLSPRTCGRIVALNRNLYGMKGPRKEAHEPKEMPFKASRRHEIWTVEVRYIEDHLLGLDPIYSITIMDNFSRAIISSAMSPRQDLTASRG